MMRADGRIVALAALAATLVGGVPAAAQEAAAGRIPDVISFGAGYYDVLENDPRDEAVDFRLEYRWGKSLLPFARNIINVRPWVGAEVTGDGAFYGLGGFLFEVQLTRNLWLTPNVGVGLYHDGGGKDLGSVVEFRSTAELTWRFDNESRLSLAFGHISNAGITETNPGAEILTLYYSVPTRWLFGG